MRRNRQSPVLTLGTAEDATITGEVRAVSAAASATVEKYVAAYY